MKYLYLDESGDTGKSEKSSNHYLWAGILTENPKRVQRCMNRARKLHAKQMDKQVHEVKYPLSESVYERALSCLMKPEFSFHYSIMVKEEYKLSHKANILSQSSISSLIENIVSCGCKDKIRVTLDRTSNNNIASFKERIIDKFPLVEDVVERDSKEDDGVQAAHLIANSVFKKFEHKQVGYYNIYQTKIETSIINPRIKI